MFDLDPYKMNMDPNHWFYLFIQVASGGLDPGIQGPRLVKMCVRCIKCFLAYFTGNKEDLETSEEEEEGEEDEEGGGRYRTY